MASHLPLITLFLFFNSVLSEIILEEGYTVTTVIDGHKLNINPYSVIARPGSSDLLLLDSSDSHLYTLSFPLSSGEPKPGYRDGELGQARFDKPRSVALDAKGNIYVADKDNHVIRKITTSGTVTTIAGGYTRAVGNKDGPSQNATFSNDFELAIVAERCILLVVDHGSQTIRQIDLKSADCAAKSPSGQLFVYVAKAQPFSIMDSDLDVLIMAGSSYNLDPRSGTFMFSRLGYGDSTSPLYYPSWRDQPHRIQQDMEALPNQFGEASSDTLLRHQKRKSRASQKDLVSLHDSVGLSNSEVKKSQFFADQMKDLICFDENLDLPNRSEFLLKHGDGNQNVGNVAPECHGRRVDSMIQANIMGFAKEAEEANALDEPVVSNSGLVKRR
ncbi:hypothetical protein COLO4_19522 [Corchorus olitorius]|uniref:Six-bladed beta-propeller, TolB-like protein n=1 Tax=Corchorus olitorius TaxID=93759 RepID=A0A1R3J4Y4_9ROSI|nr:hypothetical protein COLO4_19522 [Corchorus olitorius]